MPLPDLTELAALARAAAADPAPLRQMLRESGRALALAHGEGFRAALAELPRSERDDPFLAALLGLSHRAGREPSRLAPQGFLRGALAAVEAGGYSDFETLSVTVSAAAGQRIQGANAAAVELLSRADAALTASTELSMLERLELTARLNYELGVVQVHTAEFDEARFSLESAIGLGEDYLAPAERAELAGEFALLLYSSGDYRGAVGPLEDAHRLIDEHGLDQHPLAAAALATGVLLALESEPPDALEQRLVHARAAAAGGDMEPFVHLVAGQVATVHGRFVEALEHLARAEQFYSPWDDRGAGRDLVLGLRAVILLALGEGTAAMSVLDDVRQHPRHAVCTGRTRARFGLLTGDLDLADAALAECEALGDAHIQRPQLDVMLLRAAVEVERGDLARADHAFDRALWRLADIGAWVPLRSLPGQAAAILIDRAQSRPQSPAVTELLDRIDRETLGLVRATEPLSERERAVLGLLEHRLTVAEMAAQLYVSPNTVKTHLRRLYRKLGVGGREEAIQRARVLGIRPGVTPVSPGGDVAEHPGDA